MIKNIHIKTTLGLLYTLKISPTSGFSFLDGLKLNGEFGIYRRSADKNTGTILQIAVTWKW